MRHRKIRGRLGRTSAHRRAMINNMITSLFAHERIRTSVAKAKAARRVAERMITYAKRDTLHTRRLAHRRIRDAEVLRKLFAVLGPRYQDRPGGYTRVIRLGPRPGDGTELAILELVGRFEAERPVGEDRPKRRRRTKAERAEADAAGEHTAEEEEAAEVDDEAVEAGEKAVEVNEKAVEADEETAEVDDEAAEAEAEAEGEGAADEEAAGEEPEAEAEKAKAKPKAKRKPKRRGFLRRRPREK